MIKDYLKMVAIFLLIFISINLEVNKVIPPVMGYVFCALYVVFGFMAYQKHGLPYIKKMYIVSIAVQLLFFMAIPYWLIKNNMALNISWPLYPEVLWAAGRLLAWYAVVSFVFVPVVVLLFGRRAWCTFICGTGVLAETLGNDYRIFGSKAKTPPPGFIAIKWIILVLTVVFTVLAFSSFTREKAFSLAFMIVFILLLRTLLMQAVNIILMPKLGTRIWCKYFCPQGLLIGLISRIGRFALVKDESLCTGCGICNQHCSMSIDITGGPAVNRSGECVGCGVCVEVCPQKALSMTTGAVSGVEKSDKVGV